MGLCHGTYENICERFSDLEMKCNIKFEDLSDSSLFPCKISLKNIEIDFKEILDRIAKLTEFNPGEFQETSNLLKITSERKCELKNLMNWFKKNLEIEISKHDLSEEKVKNASILGIKIPKFRGYDSSMDFYTFKAEFEKLVSPRVQGKLLPDYLKNNYLDGHALALVKEINY